MRAFDRFGSGMEQSEPCAAALLRDTAIVPMAGWGGRLKSLLAGTLNLGPASHSVVVTGRAPGRYPRGYARPISDENPYGATGSRWTTTARREA